MSARGWREPTVVWLVLLGAVAASQVTRLGGAWPRVAGGAAFVIAFFKLRLIGLRFMELRTAPWQLRLAFEAWLVGAGTMLLIMLEGFG